MSVKFGIGLAETHCCQGSTDLSWKDGQLRLIKTYYLSQNGRRNCLHWMDVYFGRMFVWWSGLDLDIERTVASCSLCQSHRAAVPTVPLQPWTWPIQPWTRVHMDLAGPFLNQMLLQPWTWPTQPWTRVHMDLAGPFLTRCS